MREYYLKQLELLNNQLIEMGSLIESAIEMAIDALANQDDEKARRAMAMDEQIDRLEKDIEALCMKLLLQQQPVAGDLRLISSALKMITDMERIGDHATDISEICISMPKEPMIKKLTHLQQMAKETMYMLINSVDAFVRRDMELAHKVIGRDDVVDDLFVEIKGELINLIHQNPDNGHQALDLLMIGKYFERIGDHATNIAEWVIFSITGKHEKQ